MLIDDRDSICQNLRDGIRVLDAIAVTVLRGILFACTQLLMITKLGKQTFAQIAAADSRRVHLTNQSQGFVKVCQTKIC